METRIIGTTRIVSGRVYVTQCLSHLAPQPRRAAGLLVWARRAADIDRQRRAPSSDAAAWPASRRSVANAGSIMLRSEVRGTTQTCSESSARTFKQ